MIPLTPHGTARQRYTPSPRAAHDPETARYPVELRAAMREHDLGEETLVVAWELARQVAGLSPLESRALQRLVLASMVNARQGSTRLPVSGTEGLIHLDQLFSSLRAPDEAAKPLYDCARELLAELRQARLSGKPGKLGAIVGLPGDYKPLILDGYYLYHQRMLHCEDRLVAVISERLARPSSRPPDGLAAALADVEARPAVQRGGEVVLSDEQRTAVKAALAGALTVISGGPGTGKTSIVASILRILARIEVPLEAVALAAPTGKAAHRMRQSVERSLASIRDPAPADRQLAERCPEARTLHRLLGYSPTGDFFRHHENNRLSEQVIIVDEGSMIDLHLMDRLVRAVRDEASLIVLGDADQLPSVDAGAVFRDLVPHASVRLTRSFRMAPDQPIGRNILTVAQKIKDGDATALDEAALRRKPSELQFEKVELYSGPDRPFLERWYEERVRGLPELDRLTRKVYRHRPSPSVNGFSDDDARDLAALFAHAESFRILCLTRGEHGAGGAGRVNQLLHEKVLATARSHDEGDLLRAPAFYPGEPILMLKNDYDRGLFNGDQGLVLRVAEDGRPSHHFMAVFPLKEGYGVYHLDSLRAVLQLCFAMTVHKSQGSEFDHVALLLPEEDSALLTRELLYTAVTRSRHSAILVGERALLDRAIARPIRRFSGLAAKLRGLTLA